MAIIKMDNIRNEYKDSQFGDIAVYQITATAESNSSLVC